MAAYFDRLLGHWASHFGTLPKLPRPENYRRAHDGCLDKIPSGMESNADLLLVVDNTTGQAEIEDYDQRSFEPLAGSLAQLIAGLRLSEEIPA